KDLLWPRQACCGETALSLRQSLMSMTLLCGRNCQGEQGDAGGNFKTPVGPNPTLTLLANSLPRGDQRRKGGDIGICGLGMGEPGHDTFQIDADRNQNVLETSFRQAHVARPPEIKSPYPLRERAFNASPRRILGLEGGGRLIVVRRLQRFIVDLCADGDGPGFGFCTCTG